MDTGQRFATPLPATLPPTPAILPAVHAHDRIAIPLSQVLDFARHDTDSQPSRQLAGALRPLLAVALATAGFCQGLPPELPASPQRQPRRGDGAGAGAGTAGSRPGTTISAASAAQNAGAAAANGDPEILFTALSSLVEVVKSLTPSAGRIYAHLGHEAVDSDEAPQFGDSAGPAESPPGLDAHVQDPDDTGGYTAPAPPRSEVVIELVSIASPAYESLPPAIHNALGALAFELAVVAAILESKGGQLHLAASGAQSRRFVVRLPVWKH